MARGAKEVSLLVLRWLVGSVFICAGVLKALDPAQFARDVDNYRVLPYVASGALGVYLPWLEIVAGGALAFGIWRGGATLVLGIMLVVFLGALSSAWARGLDITCGCFGRASKQANYPLALAVDLALLIALYVSSLSFRKKAISGSEDQLSSVA